MGQMQRTMRRRIRRENFLSVRESARRMNLDPTPEPTEAMARTLRLASMFFLGGIVKWLLSRKLIHA